MSSKLNSWRTFRCPNRWKKPQYKEHRKIAQLQNRNFDQILQNELKKSKLDHKHSPNFCHLESGCASELQSCWQRIFGKSNFLKIISPNFEIAKSPSRISKRLLFLKNLTTKFSFSPEIWSENVCINALTTAENFWKKVFDFWSKIEVFRVQYNERKILRIKLCHASSTCPRIG